MSRLKLHSFPLIVSVALAGMFYAFYNYGQSPRGLERQAVMGTTYFCKRWHFWDILLLYLKGKSQGHPFVIHIFILWVCTPTQTHTRTRTRGGNACFNLLKSAEKYRSEMFSCWPTEWKSRFVGYATDQKSGHIMVQQFCFWMQQPTLWWWWVMCRNVRATMYVMGNMKGKKVATLRGVVKISCYFFLLPACYYSILMQTPVREWLEKRQENLAGLLYCRIMAGFDDLMVLFFCWAINQSALDIIWSSSGRNKTLAFSFSSLPITTNWNTAININIGIKCFLLPKLQLECLKKLTLF